MEAKLVYDRVNSLKTVQVLHNEAATNILLKIWAKNSDNTFYKTIKMCLKYINTITYDEMRSFLYKAICLSVRKTLIL